MKCLLIHMSKRGTRMLGSGRTLSRTLGMSEHPETLTA